MADQPIGPGLKPATLTVVWVLTGFSCTMAIARAITKAIRASAILVEDYLMLVSMVLAILFGVFTSLLCSLPLGRLEPELSSYPAPQFARALYISHAFGFMAPLFGRISFCLYMLRILNISPSTKLAMRALIILQLVVNLMMTILGLYSVWQLRGTMEARSAAGSTFMHPSRCAEGDRSICVVVWKIQAMTARKKFGIAVVLGLSFFATIASICKIYYVNALYTTQYVLPIAERLMIVMGAEINTLIIAASLPILGPLFLHRFSRASMKQIQTLPIYEVHVEKGLKRGLIKVEMLPLPGSSSTRASIFKSDPVFSNTLPEIRTDSCHGKSLKVIKTIDVTLVSTEMTEGITLDCEIVPEELQEHISTGEQIRTLSSDSWDELPTLPFLTDSDQSEYRME